MYTHLGQNSGGSDYSQLYSRLPSSEINETEMCEEKRLSL